MRRWAPFWGHWAQLADGRHVSGTDPAGTETGMLGCGEVSGMGQKQERSL